MFKWLKRLFSAQKENTMKNQNLEDITRGLQHAAATTNSLVAEQYIRILSQFFDTTEDGTLKAKMVRVQISEDYFAMVPLVSMVSPSGLALDKMKVDMSIKIEGADEKRASILDLRHGHPQEDAGGDDTRSTFAVSMSPRSKDGHKRPSDHVDISLEFVSQETPESVMRVIETYTNLIQPIQMPADGKLPDANIVNLKTGQSADQIANTPPPKREL